MAQIDNVAEAGKTNRAIRKIVRKYINKGMNGGKYQGCSEGTGFS